MEFRRSGQLDERRRRVLRDEIASPSADAEKGDVADGGSKRTPLRAYSEAVLAERQPRITDLIPVRPFLVTVLILVALTGIAAVETLFIHWRTGGAWTSSPRFASLDITGRGSIGAWYGAVLLALGSAGALVIFSVRCHRVDDYRGRYRIWLWTAAALLWGSLDCATGIHHALGAGVAILTGTPQLVDVCWLGIYLLMFGALGVRLALETWHSLGSLSALCLAVVLYLVAGMEALGLLPATTPLVATVLLTSVTLSAHLALLSAIGLFARHVHLDAAGKLPLRLAAKVVKKKRKSRTKLSVVSKEDDEDKVPPSPRGGKSGTDEDEEDDAPHSASAPARSTAASKPAVAASGSKSGPLASRVAASQAFSSADDDDNEDEDQEDDGDVNSKLSKSERRRLKKLARREQVRRAA